MRHKLPGLHGATRLVQGVFLVRIAYAQYRGHAERPFLVLNLAVVEPRPFATRKISARLYCTAKLLWKLKWFLQAFGYDSERLARNELEARALLGLCGVVKVSHSRVNGRTFVTLDTFARASEWD